MPISPGKTKIAVCGLGYVGIPVAFLFAKKGFKVFGVDTSPQKIKLLNLGKNPIEGIEPGLSELIASVHKKNNFIATTDPKIYSQANVILVCVQTPIEEESKIPEYEALGAAIESIAKNIKKGTLVVIESTLAPGTMRGFVAPILEKKSHLKIDEDLYLVHCPERVMPGRLLKNLQNCSRTIGSFDPKSAQLAKKLYQYIVKANLDLTTAATAEIVKTAENTYRDVQIAFANELAIICEKFGVNFYEARKLINKSPGRHVHLAGAGVGGHCIPKDPWLLIANLKNRKLAKIVPVARKINDSMPNHVYFLLKKALEQKGLGVRRVKVAILGYAYLENSDDTRNSPTAELVKILKKVGIKYKIHDPYVKEYKGSLNIVLKDAQALVLMTAHPQYQKLKLSELKKQMAEKIIVDGRNVFDKHQAKKEGFYYFGIGNR